MDTKQGTGIGVFVVHEICNDEICNDTAGKNPEVRRNICSTRKLEESLQRQGQCISNIGIDGGKTYTPQEGHGHLIEGEKEVQSDGDRKGVAGEDGELG